MIRDQELAGLAMTLGKDAKITITVGGDGSYCKPDGSHINIARMPSTPLGRMLMTGLVFHEVGHKNFTKGGRPDGLLGDMMNVIEDIRVDMETIKARPGTCFNLEAVTTHYVNKGSLKPHNLPHALLGKVMAYGFGRILNHSSIIKLEEECNEMMDDAFGPDFISDVESIITNLPKLKSTRDSRDMAQRVVELLIQQQMKQQKQQSAKNGQGNSSQNGSGNSSAKSQGKGQQKEGSTSGAGGTGAGNGKKTVPTAKEIEEMLQGSTGFGDLSRLIQTELNQLSAETPESTKEGIPLLPQIGRLKVGSCKLDEVDAISATSKMRAKLMGMLQSIKRQPESYGLSGRKLAAGRLVKLAVGDPRIFRKKVEVRDINTAVIVLLDLSGSMNSKCQVANAAAFALHNTLYGLKGVAVCSAEFSGKSNKPEVNILVEFGRKPLSENFNHRPFDGTPTHNAIWAARVMLLQRSEPRKILLILTDGCPDNDAATKAATRRTMKDGIEIAAIGIMEDSVKRFWDTNRVINTLQELPAAMFGVMEVLLTDRRGKP